MVPHQVSVPHHEEPLEVPPPEIKQPLPSPEKLENHPPVSPVFKSPPEKKVMTTERDPQPNEEFEPLLMSQLFVCNSTKQRLSMAKFMLSHERASELSPRASPGAHSSKESPLRRVSTMSPKNSSRQYQKLERKLTRNLKKEILSKMSVIRADTFDQEIIEEKSDEETNFEGMSQNQSHRLPNDSQTMPNTMQYLS